MSGPQLISLRKIWDRGVHNAFTDLVRFRSKWYCAFREADNHIGSAGKVRVLESVDGSAWTSVALLSEKGIDLRDPKLSVTPSGKLLLLMGGTYSRTRAGRRPRVALSDDGLTWTRPNPILCEGDWLWRVTWFRSRVYGVSYRIHSPSTWSIVLHESADAINYRPISHLKVPGKPNETTIRFVPSGQAVALVRREGKAAAAWIGASRPPYTRWTWRSAGMRVGGPNFIIGPRSSMWAAYRRYDHTGPVTVIARMSKTTLRPILALPSGGDCSYPGLVWHRGLLWVSYYSSHEGKTSIYIAKIRLR